MNVHRHHIETFESSMQKTNLWLKDIERELHADSKPKAYAALRGVLHVIRDCLPIHEAVKLSAQMPLIVRGIYFDGWKPRAKPLRLTGEEYYRQVRDALRFQPGLNAASATRAVIRALYAHMTAGELVEICDVLPRDVRAIWSEIEARFEKDQIAAAPASAERENAPESPFSSDPIIPL